MGLLGVILHNWRNMKKANKIRAMSKESLLALDDDAFYDAINCVCYDAVYDIHDPKLTDAQRFVYSLIQFEAEVNNGGLCQFFVNSSRECAPFISAALTAVGDTEVKALFEGFVSENGIDIQNLSSFKITSIDEYQQQTQRFDFDSFDDAFYKIDHLYSQTIAYAKAHLEEILK